jgi:hypothetical protein
MGMVEGLLRIYWQQSFNHSARGERSQAPGGLRKRVLSQPRGRVLVVPRKATFDHDALAGVLAKQHGVVARGQVLGCGMSPSVLRHRIRPGGPWRIVLPGVYLTHTGDATGDQREMAAILHGGRFSVVTGPAALRRHGIRIRSTDTVDVLVPVGTARQNAGFVRLHRTARLPELVCVAGKISFVLAPRAVADAVRGMTDIREARAVVADSVQRGICPVPRLAEELAAGPVRGSARLRAALAEVAEGIRSTAEADLRSLIKRARLPLPMFNPRLFAGETFIAIPDCWWPEAGVAAEVDSREWHLSPRDWERTLARHARMGSRGIIVLHFTPGQIRTRPREVASAIADALAARQGHPPSPIRARPAS